MLYFRATIMLSGDRNHVVTNKGPLSVPEIAILRQIHGASSVSDIRQCEPPETKISDEELRASLTERYQSAFPEGSEPILNRLFGPLGKLPTTLEAIGIDSRAEAAKLRETAAAAIAAAEKLDAGAGEAEGFDDFIKEDAI